MKVVLNTITSNPLHIISDDVPRNSPFAVKLVYSKQNLFVIIGVTKIIKKKLPIRSLC
jgi:hypothetical protein